MVAPDREDEIDAHGIEIGVEEAGLLGHPVEPQQRHSADDQRHADDQRGGEQNRLDESIGQKANDGGRQKRHQQADQETPRMRVVGPADRQQPQFTEIDAHDGQQRAELDDDLERLAGTLEAYEMAQQQKVSGRRDGNELGQSFHQP